MALVLLYLVVLTLVAVVLFGVASLLFGRGEQLPPLPRATTATVLPAYGVTAADVEAVKFTQVLRGYKTSEVDWVLDRLGREIETLRGQVAALQSSGIEAPPADDVNEAEVSDVDAVAVDRSGPT
ncbi:MULTISPECIES: DivIVA domain-containing protein [Mycobacterium]|uniref:Cell division protein DivIVA n=1 Tax=Mycobacterium gordonae TaxID=1778 RepID=A0A0Q2UEM7_MYCGO|nr:MULTISPECIES: DivIVA domain-containing protein [Mycobacterium]KQH79136.1 cell division protein DivIVA [Mycobacterium gordonae]MDP7726738.1 DivIVA domain-containing protein [Mycobacterium sp. TY813]